MVMSGMEKLNIIHLSLFKVKYMFKIHQLLAIYLVLFKRFSIKTLYFFLKSFVIGF